MAGEWRERPLGELTENFDSVRVPVKEADRRVGPYPYYGASGIVDYVDAFLFDGEYLLIAEDGENLRTRNTPVAFLARGKFWVNNHAHIVRGNGEADTRFLMYALAGGDISGFLTGSTMPKLTQGNMNRIPLLAPPVDEQRAVAHILGTLDDKIELNRQMNETLEAIARALFKSWFVDATASGLPKGWKEETVAAHFEITMGQSPPGETYNEIGEGLPFFQGRADFGFRFPTLRVYCTAPTRIANPGDTLVCVRAPVGDVNMAAQQCCIGRGLAAARHRTGSRSYTYYAMHALREDFDCFEAEGTVFGSMNKKDFHAIRHIVPSEEKVKDFESLVSPLDQLIENNESESRTLAALRDTLLPKLLSGAIRVKDAEKATKLE